MKRALIFAPYFLPRRRVGSMRPFRFVLHLREFGWEPVVMTLEAKGQALTEKEAHLLGGIERIEIPTPFDRTLTSESQLGAEKKTTRSGPRKRTWFDKLDRQVPVDTWLPLFYGKHRWIVEQIERVQPDVIWSTGDPWSGLVYPVRLKKQLGIPWVADFRDPWTLCRVRTAGQWAATKAADRWFERQVIEHADAVLFQAETNAAKYAQHYGDAMPPWTTITNSYDPLVFDDPVAVDTQMPATTPGDDLWLGFFGRFREMSPASLIADVLAVAKARHGDLANHLKVGSFGPLNADDAAYAEQLGVRANFEQREAVPLENALSALRAFDVLLVTTSPQRDEIIPAKLLEYLAAGRPILSLSRNPEVGRMLEHTGTGVQLSTDDKARVADVLIESLHAKRVGRPLPLPFAPDPEAIRYYDARSTTERLARLFDSVRR